MRRHQLFLLPIFVALSSAFVAAAPIVIHVDEVQSRHRLSTSDSGPFFLTLRQLDPGKHYKLWLNPAAQQGGAVRFIAEDGTPVNAYSFTASTTYQNVPVAQTGTQSTLTRFILSVRCSNCTGPAHNRSLNGLTVNPDVAPANLIKDIFIGGDCFDVTQVNRIGSTESTAQFEGGSSSIGIASGVIISTGNATDATGPNTTGSIGDDMGGGSQPDLAELAGSSTVYDASGIEFQFTPTVDNITFRFAFASEEYCEFVDAGYNDVFGFFISGPGVNGGFTGNGENIAVLPGSNTGITIDNINSQDNAAYFIPNSFGCGAQAINHDIQFDGFTQVLTAIANVQECETYTIRLLVGDVGDELYDSAVFLEANSFSAGGTTTGTAFSPITNSNMTYETCSEGYFSLDVGGDLSTTRTVNLSISPNSTATPGVDFDTIPLSVEALPGQSVVQIPVNIFADDIAEGQESIILEIDNACSCTSGSVELIIQDSPALLADVTAVEICAGDTAWLTPTVSGGIPGYSYAWSNQSSGPGISITADTTQAYTLTVTDQCGVSATAEATVWVNALPEVVFAPPPTLTCTADTVLLDASASDQGEEYLLEWGTQEGHFTSAPDGPSVFVDAPGTYTLTIEQVQTGCRNTRQVVVAQDVDLPVAEAGNSFVLDCQENTATLDGSGSEQGPYIAYEWSSADGNLLSGGSTLTPAIDASGIYTLLVTNTTNGCTAEDEVLVTEVAPEVTFDLIQPRCSGEMGAIQFPQVTGGTPPYEYSIDGGSSFQLNNSFLEVIPGEYQLMVQDKRGCTFEASGIIDQPDSIIVRTGNGEATINFGEHYDLTVQTNLASSEIADIIWSNPSTLSCGDCLRPSASPLHTTDYTVTVVSQEGCIGQAGFRIIVDRTKMVYIPNAFSPNGDGINDHFYIFSREGVIKTIRAFRVFDRWGKPVFAGQNLRPNNPEHGWDGTLPGEALNNAIFAWFAEIEFTDGTVETFSGDVQLSR